MKNKILFCMAVLLAGSITASGQHPNRTISYLEVYDTETDTHKVIKEFPFVVEAPNWTPDGKWLVVNTGGKLCKIAPDGSTDLIEMNTGTITQCCSGSRIAAWAVLERNISCSGIFTAVS